MIRAYNQVRVAIGTETDAQSFAETRRTLLEALDRSEQAAHDQAAELVLIAEQRAREITIKADQSAALVEEQLVYLTTQLDHVRERVTDIRTRLARELQAKGSSGPSNGAVQADSRVEPSPPRVEYVATIAHAPQEPSPHEPVVSDTDSLPETLRVLRAALESLNGQAANDARS
jgi:hypothetical protein